MFEQLDVLRRIAERGKSLSEMREGDVYSYQDGYSSFIDIFVHLLDEIAKTKNYYETYEEIE